MHRCISMCFSRVPHWIHWTGALLYASPPRCSRETTYRWPGRRASLTTPLGNGRTCSGCTGRSAEDRGRGQGASEEWKRPVDWMGHVNQVWTMSEFHAWKWMTDVMQVSLDSVTPLNTEFDACCSREPEECDSVWGMVWHVCLLRLGQRHQELVFRLILLPSQMYVLCMYF